MRSMLCYYKSMGKTTLIKTKGDTRKAQNHKGGQMSGTEVAERNDPAIFCSDVNECDLCSLLRR